jgi:hypothetical protein
MVNRSKQKTSFVIIVALLAVSVPSVKSVLHAQDAGSAAGAPASQSNGGGSGLQYFDQVNATGGQSSDSSQQGCASAYETSSMGNFDATPCPTDTNQSSQSSDQTPTPASFDTNSANSSDNSQNTNQDLNQFDSNPSAGTNSDSAGTQSASLSNFDTGLTSTDDQSLAQFDQPASSPSLNVPLLNQNDPANGPLGSEACGPTAVAMIAAYYGISASVPNLIQQAGTTNGGTPTENLVSLAQQIGLVNTTSNLGGSVSDTASGVVDAFTDGSASYSALTNAVSNGNPAIVNVDLSGFSGGHAMVVTGISNGEVYVNNPGNGQAEAYGETQFMAMWGSKGFAYVIPKP